MILIILKCIHGYFFFLIRVIHGKDKSETELELDAHSNIFGNVCLSNTILLLDWGSLGKKILQGWHYQIVRSINISKKRLKLL
jgi:hypothetical protein